MTSKSGESSVSVSSRSASVDDRDARRGMDGVGQGENREDRWGEFSSCRHRLTNSKIVLCPPFRFHLP